MRSQQVLSYNKPKIMGYNLQEDRSTMQNPINFGEGHQQMNWGFIDNETLLPIEMDWRIG